MIIEENVDVKFIAEDFIIGELIKLFPRGNDEFYDKLRYYVRDLHNVLSDDRFWRLLAGFSDYMLKRHFRLLRGNQYKWSLEEVPIDSLYVKMLKGSGTLDQIIEKAGYNAEKAGIALRKIAPIKRQELIDPFKFHKDYYPIFVIEEDGELIVHDGNRRTIDNAIFGNKTIKAYVGRPKEQKGKPAIPEPFLATFCSIIKDTENVTDKLVESMSIIFNEIKKDYLITPELTDEYIAKYIVPFLKNTKQKKILKDILGGDY